MCRRYGGTKPVPFQHHMASRDAMRGGDVERFYRETIALVGDDRAKAEQLIAEGKCRRFRIGFWDDGHSDSRCVGMCVDMCADM